MKYVSHNKLRPKAIILRTAGTNCDYETKYALEKAGASVDLMHINQLLNEKGLLDLYQILVLPGGFTYGDDIAAGKVLANQLRHHLLDELIRFVDNGKLVIGICNGFQVLVKMGLLPRIDGTQASLNGYKQEFTLTYNDSNKFEDRWVYLKSFSNKSVFIDKDSIFYVPIAHAEGKFMAEDEEKLKMLSKSGQIVFKYVDKDGNITNYPWNPNGSLDNIAGICDSTGRVLGMMPHPERHIEPTQHPRWTREGLKTEGDGIVVFRNAVNYISGIL
ncbi:MAG: phosphoribosylformylglycinamidine synthase I [Candidatus Scalindua rubra]|uniref:Phosphoribosylformylglycinamidine synthase subunit PurQ n=1 Tax=Candidatus Scalindua rubra TaxID=1872076 RepID=A0A1E3XD23_9BACT|nr:MAG: phosphoribosylformylglycinamidine synthase I [Candidatus Scalindua rubra]